MDTETIIQELDKHGLELVIGLETHIRLNTQTKMFCSCSTAETEIPNEHICPVCTGQMGVLPAANKEAIKKAVYFGKAVNSSMKNELICWDRKHYEYPDLPKNFQLTQFQKPIIPDGRVSCYREDGSIFTVELEQVHIEEDAAKLMHERNQTLVDFNKSGVPLIEVVTKPCIHYMRDASIYAQYLQRIVQNLKISEANLEKGEFKSDVSVSLRKKGTDDLNPRAEIKNLNSFKFMMEAIVEEVTKQLAYYSDHQSFRPDQTTVLFDADLKQTKTMRKKEFAADYRYAQEPDIPLVNIKQAIEEIEVDPGLLPFSIETTLIGGGVRPQDAKFFTSDPLRSSLFLAINEKVGDPLFIAKTLTNNLKPEDYPGVTSPDALIEIIGIAKDGKYPVTLIQHAIQEILKDHAFNYLDYFEKNSVSDEKINQLIHKVIEENTELALDVKSGNLKRAGILVGKVMAKTGKGASGKLVREKLLSILAAEEIRKGIDETPGKKKNGKSVLSSGTTSGAYKAGEIIIKENYRTHKISEISTGNLSDSVTLSGWVSSVRDHGELVFIDLRDSSYEIFQVRLTRAHFPNLDDLARLTPESVITVTGEIIHREEDDFHPELRTGTIELDAKQLDVLNHAKPLPFEIRRASRSSEGIRYKYKFLDHRNADVRRAIVNRHKVIKLIRDILDDQEFLEIETPILSSGTDEGAREFIVPSRKFPGKFYTLPQAPQQFKQMLMVGGFEKYFQIARCFRDEDSRGDRQPEFTQLDIEMAYISQKDIMDVNTYVFNEIVKRVYGKKWKLFPFQILTYQESMDKYGTDRPDLRFGLGMEDITDSVRETSFQVFTKPIEEGGIVKCIKVEGSLSSKRLSKGQIENLTAIAQSNGLGGLAYIIVNKNDLQSPIIKYLGEDIAAKIIERVEAVEGDIVFFSAADFKTANKALDAVRQELGRMLNLIKHNELHPAWIIDFPFFELTDEGKWTFTHNPFSMPKVADLQKHMEGKDIGSIITQQYDLILNGFEIGGGSIRAHKAEILEATYRNMGYDKAAMIKSVGHMYEAFQYGAPPHGGIAWGIDRLMMILEKKHSIRDVMAFPKTGTGEDLMFNSPSALSEKKIEEANIRSLSGKNAMWT